MEEYKFLFILSHPRSGSSYLTHIITKNTDIFVFKEFFNKHKGPKINIQKQINYFNEKRNTNIEMYEENTNLNEYLNKTKKELIKSGSTIGFTVFYNQLSIKQIECISKRNDIKFITLERKDKIEFGFSYYFSKKTGIFNSKQKSEFEFSKFYFDFKKIKEYIDNYYNFINELRKYSSFHFIYDNSYDYNIINDMLSKITLNFKKIEESIYDKHKTNFYSLSPNYYDVYNKLKLIYEC